MDEVLTFQTADITNFLLPVVSGLSSARAVKELKKRFKINFSPTDLSETQAKVQTNAPLEQGGPVGVALMTGDIRVGFIGTATLLKDNRVFSFGHPIFFSGPTNLPLTKSVVYETARGMWPAKIADLGVIIGTALQDRIAGIFGRTDVLPSVAELNYSAEDLDRRKTETVKAHATRFQFNLPFLSYLAAIELFDRVMNRIGQGSAKCNIQKHWRCLKFPFLCAIFCSRHMLFSARPVLTNLTVTPKL